MLKAIARWFDLFWNGPPPIIKGQRWWVDGIGEVTIAKAGVWPDWELSFVVVATGERTDRVRHRLFRRGAKLITSPMPSSLEGNPDNLYKASE